MLDLKNWFSPKHYKRLWNVGPPGLTASLILIYLTLQYEAAFSIKKYETGHMWVDVLFFLIFLEMLFILFWTLFSCRPKTEEENYLQGGYIPLFVTPYIQLLFFTQTYLHLCGWVHIYCSFWCRYSTCCGQKWLSKKKNTLLAYLGKNI